MLTLHHDANILDTTLDDELLDDDEEPME